MARYNLHWEEICNIEIDAENEEEAQACWAEGCYELDEVGRDYPGRPTITLCKD